jgi:hypothetical protein
VADTAVTVRTGHPRERHQARVASWADLSGEALRQEPLAHCLGSEPKDAQVVDQITNPSSVRLGSLHTERPRPKCSPTRCRLRSAQHRAASSARVATPTFDRMAWT